MNFIEILFRYLIGEKILNQLKGIYLKQLLKVLLLHLFSLVASFASTWLIARHLGKEGYGLFVYGFSWISILVIIACLGFETLLLRELPGFLVNKSSDKAKSLINFAFKTTFIFAIVISIISAASFSLFEFPSNPSFRKVLFLALPALPFLVSISISSSILRGFKLNGYSMMVEKIIRPSLLFLLAASLIFASDYFNVINLIIGNLFVLGISALTAGVVVYFKIMRKLPEHKKADNVFEWKNIAWNILLINILFILTSQIATLFLGWLSSEGETGMYGLSLRLIELPATVVTLFNFVLAPIFAEYFSDRKTIELASLTKKTSLVMITLSLPLIILYLLVPSFCLSLFGNSYSGGEPVLILFSFIQIIVIINGNANYLLLMSGNTLSLIRITGFSLLIQIVLCIVLIPEYGAYGAALATVGQLLFQNTLVYFSVKKKLGFSPAFI